MGKKCCATDVLNRFTIFFSVFLVVSLKSIVLLYYSLVYSYLTYALLAWERSGNINAAKIECAHRRACKLLTYYNKNILTFHSIYDYFALLKAFNTNTLNFHQYFKDKLSFHQPSHMHITRHRANRNFNTPLFNCSET